MRPDPDDVFGVDTSTWKDEVPEWLVRSRPLAGTTAVLGVVLLLGGLAVQVPILVPVGFLAIAFLPAYFGIAFALRPRWGHHMGAGRYSDPTTDPPSDGDLAPVRRHAILQIGLALGLVVAGVVGYAQIG